MTLKRNSSPHDIISKYLIVSQMQKIICLTTNKCSFS